MDKLSTLDVAALVRHYLAGRHVEDITFEVDAEHIESGDNWWRVPVRPSRWPKRLFLVYEEMAEVEGEILETKGLNVLLFTAEPLTEDEQTDAIAAAA